MIIADTSVWIDHFRLANARLAALLDATQILVHPFVIGEIALGHLKDRKAVLEGLALMPQAAVATEQEVLTFIETAKLAGSGIGYIDAHLLASAKLDGALLWTRDRRLAAVAGKAGVGFA